MPKISVIIPVFNMKKFVGACLDSVLAQTLTDIEVIVINDGSTDNSLEIIREYQKRDSRIVVIDKNNAGVGAARNDGIRVATGEFLAFMDPDDMYASDEALAHCYEAAIREGVSIAGGRNVLLYEDGTTREEVEKKIGDIVVSANGLTEYKEYQYDYGYLCFIYKRKLIIDNQIFFPLYSRFQDPPFFVKAMIKAERFYALEEPVYLYRQLPGAAKMTPIKTLDCLQGIIDNLQISKENNLVQLHYISAERLNREGSYMALHNLESAEAKKILYKFIQATAMIDVEWLKKEGFVPSDYFLPEVFDYVLSTSVKYERLRKNVFLRTALGIFSRVTKWIKK
ncbi:glycosyltransferase family 2 protein [Fusicatenibacter sp.]